MSTRHTLWQLARLIRWQWFNWLLDMGGFGFRLSLIPLVGLVLRGFFNGLTGEPGPQVGVVAAALWQLLLGVLALAGIVIALYGNFAYRYHSMALLIRNLFSRILDLPGAVALPLTAQGRPQASGQVLSTLRDDTREVSIMMIHLLDIVAFGVASILSLVIMWRINPWITLGVFVPLLVIVAAVQRLEGVIKRTRAQSREATSRVTGLIGDLFNSTQAIKVGQRPPADPVGRFVGRQRHGHRHGAGLAPGGAGHGARCLYDWRFCPLHHQYLDHNSLDAYDWQRDCPITSGWHLLPTDGNVDAGCARCRRDRPTAIVCGCRVGCAAGAAHTTPVPVRNLGRGRSELPLSCHDPGPTPGPPGE
jgi:hypothetical protein